MDRAYREIPLNYFKDNLYSLEVYMSTLKNILLVVVIVTLVSLLVAGCAFHAETSMGAGSGTKYSASMRGGRGVGIDFPADAENISRKTETKVTRAARD